MKAIIRRAKMENCIRQLTRHATPKRFTHLCLSGANGRQFYEHVDTEVAGVFVFGLEDWVTLPALAKTPDGFPLHRFAGRTQTEQVLPEEFDSQDVIELYISGWIEKFVNCTRTDKVSYLGLQIDDATFLDAIDPAFIPFRSDTMDWADVDERYKLPDGSPRVDVDSIKLTTLITPPPVAV